MRRRLEQNYHPRAPENVSACAAGQDGYAATKAIKTRMLLATSLLLAFFASAADNFRYVAVAATHDGPATIQIGQNTVTNPISSTLQFFRLNQ